MKKNRVAGLIIVGADKALWNADFEGNPNRCLDEYVGSPFSLKYAYRKYWDTIGLDVFFYKTYFEKEDNGVLTLLPKSLDKTLGDRLVVEFGADSTTEVEKKGKGAKKGAKKDKKSNISHEEIQNMVFKCIDVSCFGGAFATTMFTRSYVGAIQFGYGINKYKDAEVIVGKNLSPFQNSNKEDNAQATNGTVTYLNEGHFVYDFVVNPTVNNAFAKVHPSFKGFTEDDYQKFKEASLVCINNLQSLSKKGCYNELAMFIEFKEGSKKYLGNLNKKVMYDKSEDGKGIIDLSLVEKDLLAIMDDIEKIEIYHNPVDTKVVFSPNPKTEIKNILSEKKVDFTKL